MEQFPLSFKLCAKEITNISDRYKQFGYTTVYAFYQGRKRFLRGKWFGWAGHGEGNQTLASVRGKNKFKTIENIITIFHNFIQYILFICISDVLSNVTFDWRSILRIIIIRNPSGNWLTWIPGKNISWSLIPQFPACQTLNISHYFDLKRDAPTQIIFHFNKIQNLGITVEIEDIRKSLSRRKINSNSFDYEGPPIELKDLSSSKIVSFGLSLSQTIDLEAGKNCKIYPNQIFSSYRECDESFVYNEILKNYSMMPFWAAKKIDEITDIAYMTVKILELD